jgi:hypothetical protein
MMKWEEGVTRSVSIYKPLGKGLPRFLKFSVRVPRESWRYKGCVWVGKLNNSFGTRLPRVFLRGNKGNPGGGEELRGVGKEIFLWFSHSHVKTATKKPPLTATSFHFSQTSLIHSVLSKTLPFHSFLFYAFSSLNLTLLQLQFSLVIQKPLFSVNSLHLSL